MRKPIRVGQTVPDFNLDVYDPKKGDFDSYSLEAARGAGRWTVLFFYPADFTFV